MDVFRIYKLRIDVYFGSKSMANIEKLQNPLKITEIADKINEIIEGGTGGSGLVFGSTIFSLIPLTEAGLHLLDGSLLNVGGIYDEAITKIAALQSSNPNLFTTEENWQSSVSTYGVCGKFVYTEGVSLRLPKVTGFVEGTLDAGALGDLVEAGLPNITGAVSFAASSIVSSSSGCFSSDVYGSVWSGGSAVVGGNASATFDASRSSVIYGKSTTVQPQAIKGYLYIVLATSSKTDVQVDIDNIAADLNEKARTDLANIDLAGRNVIANMAMPSDSYVDLSFNTSGTVYTAPADGYFYYFGITTVDWGDFCFMTPDGNFGSTLARAPNGGGVRVLCPCGKGRSVMLSYSGSLTTYTFRFYYAEGGKPE